MNSVLCGVIVALMPALVFTSDVADFSEDVLAHECVPRPVQNLKLTPNNTITWNPPEDAETCTIKKYLLFISKGDYNYVLETLPTARSVSVAFLEHCTLYNFTVVAVSTQDVEGWQSSLNIKTQMPGGQTLLTVRNVTLLEQGQTVVANWSLDENLQSCVHFYRLVYWDDFSEVPKDVYTTNTSYTIPNVVPCSKYNVKVSAWTSPTQEGPVATAAYTTIAKPSAQPHIFNLVVDKHAAEMVWHLPEYHCNRCPISKVIVDATPQFKLTIPYQDSPLRPDVVINLTNLTESTVYKCDVYLQNNAGLSPPVHVLIQTHYEPTPPPPTSPTPAPTPPTPPPTSPTPAPTPPTSPTPAPTPPTPAPTPPPTPAPAPPAPNPLNPPRPLSPH